MKQSPRIFQELFDLTMKTFNEGIIISENQDNIYVVKSEFQLEIKP